MASFDQTDREYACSGALREVALAQHRRLSYVRSIPSHVTLPIEWVSETWLVGAWPTGRSTPRLSRAAPSCQARWILGKEETKEHRLRSFDEPWRGAKAPSLSRACPSLPGPLGCSVLTAATKETEGECVRGNSYEVTNYMTCLFTEPSSCAKLAARGRKGKGASCREAHHRRCNPGRRFPGGRRFADKAKGFKCLAPVPDAATS